MDFTHLLNKRVQVPKLEFIKPLYYEKEPISSQQPIRKAKPKVNAYVKELSIGGMVVTI